MLGSQHTCSGPNTDVLGPNRPARELVPGKPTFFLTLLHYEETSCLENEQLRDQSWRNRRARARSTWQIDEREKIVMLSTTIPENVKLRNIVMLGNAYLDLRSKSEPIGCVPQNLSVGYRAGLIFTIRLSYHRVILSGTHCPGRLVM